MSDIHRPYSVKTPSLVKGKDMNVNKAKNYLRSYIRLSNFGFSGRLLSPEYKEYRKESPKPTCDLLTWCVKKALAELNK